MRKNTLRFACALLAAGVTMSGTALAHHSFAMFDMAKTISITGTVKEFQWTNPHTWVWLEVPNEKGVVEEWGLEGMSPNFLGRRGWSKHTLKPGDTVTVAIHPLKDGAKGGTFLNVTLPDGKVMVMFGAPPGAPPPNAAPPAEPPKQP